MPLEAAEDRTQALTEALEDLLELVELAEPAQEIQQIQARALGQAAAAELIQTNQMAFAKELTEQMAL